VINLCNSIKVTYPLLYNLQSFIASAKICSTLSSQNDSELFSENNNKIVFNLFANIAGFKCGLCNGLYFIFEFNPISIKSFFKLYLFIFLHN
jgi:hypothetical protein